MQYLFETSDFLNAPYEGFLYDANTEAFPVHPHWHYFIEFMYLIEGTALVTCSRETYALEPGDFMIFHPQTVHAIYSSTNIMPKYYVLKFDLNRLNTTSNYAPKFRTILHNAENNNSCPVFLPAAEMQQTAIPRLIREYVNEVSSKDYGYDLLANAQLSAILTCILRIWRNRGFDLDKIQPINADLYNIGTITEYIDLHSDEPLRVEELARLCNMSYSHFAKSFRELYGQSCKEFIEFIRVCKVEDFLLFTECDLTYISQETGFSDCSHLIKTFRKIRGITPKQYKLQRKGGKNTAT